MPTDEYALVGACIACDGTAVATVRSVGGDAAHAQFECQDCGSHGRVDWTPGETDPRENPDNIVGVRDLDYQEVRWVDCHRCCGHGWVEDPLCDLQAAMHGRSEACPECHTEGTVPEVV